MHYISRIFLLPLLFLFGATSAMAEGFYAGAGFASMQIEDEDQGISFEDHSWSSRLLAGYDFSDNFGIEGSYINSGEAEGVVFGENVQVELSAFTLSIVGLLPVNDNSQLFGKVGYYNGKVEATVQDQLRHPHSVTLDEDEDGMIVGVGVRWSVNDTFVVRGEFDRLTDTDLDALWSVGVGFQYYFGK